MERYPLFTKTSVTADDFKWLEIPLVPIKPSTTECDPLEKLKPIQRPKQIDLETMHPFKQDVYVPFELLFRAKPIVQENPYVALEDLKAKDILFEETLKVRKVRPRTFVIPQIPLDDVPEEKMYGPDGLAAHIYTSDWKKASEYAAANSHLKSAKSVCFSPEKRRDVFIERNLAKTRFQASLPISPMSPGYGKYVDDWNGTNPVEFVDTTELFWRRNRDKGLCQLCDPPPKEKVLTNEEEQEIEDCLRLDILRTPYTLHPPGYCGYVPKTPVNIKFRKKMFRKHEPLVSTLMEAQGIYDKRPIS